MLGLVGGVLVPRLIARIPEPEPSPSRSPRPTPTSPSADDEPEEPKEPYADIAALPGLAWKCALAAAAWRGADRARRSAGAGRCWSLLPLVPIAVALAVVDWRTRLLPTRLIAPTYACWSSLVLVAWLLGRPGDTDDLVRAALGWLVAGGLYLLLWFVYPRGMGYGDVRLSGVLGLALGYLGWARAGGRDLRRVPARRRDRRAAVAAAAWSTAQGYPFGPFMLLGAARRASSLGQPICWSPLVQRRRLSPSRPAR